MTPAEKVHALLDEAAEAYAALANGKARARVEQFDSHLATVHMVVDLTADEAEKE